MALTSGSCLVDFGSTMVQSSPSGTLNRYPTRFALSSKRRNLKASCIYILFVALKDSYLDGKLSRSIIESMNFQFSFIYLDGYLREGRKLEI